MRFLKKTGYQTIEHDAAFYKDFELHTTIDSLSNCEKIKGVLEKEKAVVAAVHIPLSRFSNDAENYISLCELLNDDSSFELFEATCELAEKLCRSAEIIVIVHTGCAYGCGSYDRCCHESVCDPRLSEENAQKLYALLSKYPHVNIALENITPYIGGNGEIGCNSGHKHECFEYAKLCNEAMDRLDKQRFSGIDGESKPAKVGGTRFGVTVDICHIIATQHIIGQCECTPLEAIQMFLQSSTVDRKLIKLLHLSDYNKDDNTHGEVFDKTFAEELCSWLSNDLLQDSFFPATLELKHSDDVQLGHSDFMNTVIRFSLMHPQLKSRINDSLYIFLGQLYDLYSTENTSDPLVYTMAKAVRRFVLDNTDEKDRGREIFGFTNGLQKLSMSQLRIRAYIMYVRACTIAKSVVSQLDSIGWNDPVTEATQIILHYIFSDPMGEIVCDGIRPYYNAYWLPDKGTIYHCEDGFCGETDEYYSPDSFTKIIRDCHDHIFKPYYGYDLLSYSRNFGMVLLKYLDPDKPDNFTVITDMDINYVCLENGERVSLQRYQRMTKNGNKLPVNDFSVDFSGILYHIKADENDTKSIVSNLENIFSKAGCTGGDFASPQKDGEVIYMRQPQSGNIKTYTINLPSFIIMILMYFGILRSQRIFNERFIKDTNMLKELARYTINYITSHIQKDGLLSDINITMTNIPTNDIAEILSTVDFEHERMCQDLFAMPTKTYVECHTALMNTILDQNDDGNWWTELGVTIVKEWQRKEKMTK